MPLGEEEPAIYLSQLEQRFADLLVQRRLEGALKTVYQLLVDGDRATVVAAPRLAKRICFLE